VILFMISVLILDESPEGSTIIDFFFALRTVTGCGL
jgi:hypothetical protein